MLLMALYPILWTYVSFLNLNYGETALFIVSLIIFFQYPQKLFSNLPRGYMLFWGICAICLVLHGGGFKFSYLIPGGVVFFIFSVSLAASSLCFSIEKFYKYYRIAFVFSVIVFILQTLRLLPEQYNYLFVLPFSDHIAYTGTELSTVFNHRNGGRSSSFFLEPAYYSQFVTIFLILELFYKAGKNKLYTKTSLFVIVLLIFIRSGLGMLGLVMVLTYKAYDFLSNSRNYTKYLLILIPLVFFFLKLYLGSEMGESLLERKEELTMEDSSGYVRILQGALFFSNLPLLNKFIGVSQEQLIEFNKSIITYGPDDYISLFTNGFFTLTLSNGLIGLFVFLVMCYLLYKASNSLGRCSLWVLLSFSLVEQVYLGSSMLICLFIACADRIKGIPVNAHCQLFVQHYSPNRIKPDSSLE